MAMEEARAMEAAKTEYNNDEDGKDEKSPIIPARPLDCLFQVAHNFLLSWQLEILSAQAQALRKSVWTAEGALTKSTPIVVTPVSFFSDGNTIGTMNISFWGVDDRHGPPAMGDLNESKASGQIHDKSVSVPPSTNQLTLSIRAEADSGTKVSLSGGISILERMNTHPHVRETVSRLIEAASNPFSLSASNALLAATTLCAEQKCEAVVRALLSDARILPPWIHVSADRASILVAAEVTYGDVGSKSELIALFRLGCDGRTGNFVSTFARSFKLLRLLASNDVAASECNALCAVKLSQSRRKAAAPGIATGRLVKDAFEGLNRSMNALGLKAGLGEPWHDKDDESALIRQRAIHSASLDVRLSLMNCCAMAAMYGLAALSLGTATGISAGVDLAGGAVESLEGKTFMTTPPISVTLDQRLIHRIIQSEGEKKKQSYLERNLFAITCSVSDTALTLYALDATVITSSPAEVPVRENCSLVPLKPTKKAHTNGGMNGEPRKKKSRPCRSGLAQQTPAENSDVLLMKEVEKLAALFMGVLSTC
jgi:hypothetical protein